MSSSTKIVRFNRLIDQQFELLELEARAREFELKGKTLNTLGLKLSADDTRALELLVIRISDLEDRGRALDELPERELSTEELLQETEQMQKNIGRLEELLNKRPELRTKIEEARKGLPKNFASKRDQSIEPNSVERKIRGDEKPNEIDRVQSKKTKLSQSEEAAAKVVLRYTKVLSALNEVVREERGVLDQARGVEGDSQLAEIRNAYRKTAFQVATDALDSASANFKLIYARRAYRRQLILVTMLALMVGIAVGRFLL